MAYVLTLHRPNGEPAATLKTTSAPVVAATIEGWLDRVPAYFFDKFGELTVAITHDGQPIDSAVLAEHIEQFADLTGDPEGQADARRGNPKADDE